MANPVVETSLCTCIFGAAPCPLSVTSQQTVSTFNLKQATIMDNKFPTFGMCSCPSNPAVVAATAAKLGVFTPAPCVPMTQLPWATGVPTILVCGKPLLNDSSKLVCLYGGVIQVSMTPAKTVSTP